MVLTYSCDNVKSFKQIEFWMKQVEENASENVCKMLLGNKSDLAEKYVKPEEGKALADKMKIPFFEVSAKDGANITEAFQVLAVNIRDNIDENPIIKVKKPRIRLGDEKKKSKGKCKC